MSQKANKERCLNQIIGIVQTKSMAFGLLFLSLVSFLLGIVSLVNQTEFDIANFFSVPALHKAETEEKKIDEIDSEML